MSRRPLEAVHAWAAQDDVIAELTQKQRDVVAEKHERGFAEAMSGYAEKYPDVPVTTRMTDDAAPVRWCMPPSRRPTSSWAADPPVGCPATSGPWAARSSSTRTAP